MSNIVILPPTSVTAATVVNFSAGTTSGNLGSVVFSNSNGVSFGLNGSTITASAAAGGGGGAAISAGTQSVSTGTVVFSNSNGITFGMSGSSRITASHNALTQQSTQPVALSGSNGSFAFSTATFGASNGASFYTTNGSLVVSYTVPAAQTNQTVGLYATSNTTQSSSGTVDARSLTFAGAGLASVGVTGNSVVISVPVGAPSPVNFSAGTTSGNLDSVVFSNSNGVSFGLNGSTITASAGAAAAVTISGAVLAPFNGDRPFAQSSISLGHRSLYVYPYLLREYLTLDHIRIPVLITNSSSAVAQAGKAQLITLGIYTRNSTNATVLTLHYSTSYSVSASISSNVSMSIECITAIGNSTSYNAVSASSAGINLSASLHGPRELIVPVSSLLSAGEYWFALLNSTNVAVAAGNVLNISNLAVAYQTFNRPGLSTNASLSGFHQFMGAGTYSATTTALPAGISMTQIRQLGTLPILFAATGTD